MAVVISLARSRSLSCEMAWVGENCSRRLTGKARQCTDLELGTDRDFQDLHRKVLEGAWRAVGVKREELPWDCLQALDHLVRDEYL